jgi:hypothetical protein
MPQPDGAGHGVIEDADALAVQPGGSGEVTVLLHIGGGVAKSAQGKHRHRRDPVPALIDHLDGVGEGKLGDLKGLTGKHHLHRRHQWARRVGEVEIAVQPGERPGCRIVVALDG